MKTFLLSIALLTALTYPSFANDVLNIDTNEDGKFDQWQYLNETGKKLRIDYDKNRDGKIDSHPSFSPSRVRDI